MADSFLLSQPFVDRIRSTIERVDGTPLPGAGGTKRGPILDDQPAAASQLVIGKTTAAWGKGTSATIEVYAKSDRSNSGRTIEAYNLFADVGEDKWVAVLSGYLISAEC